MKRIFATLLFSAAVLAADKGWKLPPENIKLEKAPGVEVVSSQCALCHSLDYIAIQPPLNRAAWMATIAKMKEKYGAPIMEQSTNSLVDYLAKTYGAEKSATKR
jgi:sulfite dehydrogenase (cytochrome) subunit B